MVFVSFRFVLLCPVGVSNRVGRVKDGQWRRRRSGYFCRKPVITCIELQHTESTRSDLDEGNGEPEGKDRDDD